MSQNEPKAANVLRIIEILYLFTLVFSLYLLLLSRTGEARTIWEVLNPFFIPTLFVTTCLLFIIVFAAEKVAYKLLFVIAYSILIHSFFPIIFPAGDLSGQQMVLGRARLVFDDAVFHGWTPWPSMPLIPRVYEWFRGTTFQSALSVVFARMLSIDLLWVHLFLVPVLWGVFVPLGTFLTTKAIGGTEEVAVFSSLLVSAFPYATYFGAISVPNSLGFIFFLYSFIFMLRSFNSNDSESKVLMLILPFFSFLSHFLTGIMSFALLLLGHALKSYRREKTRSPTSKFALAISFLLSTSLLPLSFIYLRLFQPDSNAVFAVNKLLGLPIEEIVGLFLLGELTYGFDLGTITLVLIGPVIALLCAIYFLINLKGNPSAESRTPILFLCLAFFVILMDYRILKLFMSGLPLDAERLWVLRDLVAVPLAALAIYGAFSSIKRFLRARFPSLMLTFDLKGLSKRSVLHGFFILLALNIVTPVLLAVWTTLSLRVAYPQVAPLQTTWYELEAVKYIEENTLQKYVVIGDVWTIYAGEVIVGVNNPRAYYFLEFNRTGYTLFFNMKQDPSAVWMLSAMNYTDTEVAYFIITESRLGTQEFNTILSKALQNDLQVYGPTEGFGNGRLYVFRHERT